MKTKISALVDGELEPQASDQVIDMLGRDDASRETWRLYHVISDTLRDTALRSTSFSARCAEKLAAEPTVLAPGRLAAEPRRWTVLSAVASLAAVALVGWLAFAPDPEMRPGALPGTPIASAPQGGQMQSASTESVRPVARQAVERRRGSLLRPALVLVPEAANDYLFAHQEFSPRTSLQGMAPYVRTVSAPTVEATHR